MDEKLQAIIQARRDAYTFSLPMLVACVLMITAAILTPFLAPVIGVVLFIIWYRRIVAIARLPCPSCGKPFGTSSPVVLSVGTGQCSNCGLSLHAEAP